MDESSSSGGWRLNENAKNLILKGFFAAIDFLMNNAG